MPRRRFRVATGIRRRLSGRARGGRARAVREAEGRAACRRSRAAHTGVGPAAAAGAGPRRGEEVDKMRSPAWAPARSDGRYRYAAAAVVVFWPQALYEAVIARWPQLVEHLGATWDEHRQRT